MRGVTMVVAAVDRYLLFAGPTAASPQQRPAAGEWDRRTDGRTDDSCINPSPHTMRAVSTIDQLLQRVLATVILAAWRSG